MTDQLADEATEDTVVVSREVSQPLETVWGALLTPTGMQALLGAGGQLGDKGDTWTAEDGTFGVTRSFHPMEQIRFSWHADEESPRTLVDLHLRPESDGSTLVEIRHDHLGANLDAGDLEKHWSQALDRIQETAFEDTTPS